VGAATGTHTALIDARWLMAYAAALGESDPRYFDTGRDGGPLVHPLFPVCYEWPPAVELRERVIGRALAPRSVHATHHLVIHRPPRTGDRLRTTGRVAGARQGRSGVLLVVRLETVDRDGQPVTTTDYGSVYRGVELEGEKRPIEAPVDLRATVRDGGTGPVRWTETVEVSARAAHVYTECARIWNPIHTDVTVARAAGLPRQILHGTATLAFAVSRVVTRDLDGDPALVREVTARFTGMVFMPGTLAIRAHGPAGAAIAFDAVDGGGAPVLAGTVGRA
jgi:acyl dehydratase